MSAIGTAGIYFLKPNITMNGAKHAELLNDKLPTHMAIHQSLIFMHDGAPYQKNHIKILEWPENSPDLSLIENLWFKIKDLVSQKHPEFSSELVKVIKKVWVKTISRGYGESLIYIMPHQLQAVIDACGGHTKY